MNFHPAPAYIYSDSRKEAAFFEQKLQKTDKKTCIYDSYAVYLLAL